MQNRAQRWKQQGYEFAINQPKIIATLAFFLGKIPVSPQVYNILFQQDYELMTRAEIVENIGFFSGKVADGAINTAESAINSAKQMANRSIQVAGAVLDGVIQDRLVRAGRLGIAERQIEAVLRRVRI